MISADRVRSPVIELRSLRGGYGRREVVTDITLNILSGDFAGIIGPNGSGKTTLLRLLSRVMRPSGGEVLVGGRDIAAFGAKEFFRQVAFVSQDTHAAFPFTVGQIVLMGRIPHVGRMETESRRDREVAENAMALTDTLHLREAPVTELSAGERQRVLIARALAQEPDILMLDEPTSHLDIGHQVQALDLIKKLNRERGLTVLLVLHDLNLAAAYCNRIVLMEKGRIFADGAPAGVLTYQNIEAVYKTVVVVRDNPMTGRPHIFVIPWEELHSS